MTTTKDSFRSKDVILRASLYCLTESNSTTPRGGSGEWPGDSRVHTRYGADINAKRNDKPTSLLRVCRPNTALSIAISAPYLTKNLAVSGNSSKEPHGVEYISRCRYSQHDVHQLPQRGGSSVCFCPAHCLCISPSEKPSYLTEKAA